MRRRKRTPLREEDVEAAAQIVFRDYESFIHAHQHDGASDDPKAFANRHAAGKAALAHLELLWKLGGGATEDGAPLTEAIAAARAALAMEPEEKEAEADAEPG